MCGVETDLAGRDRSGTLGQAPEGPAVPSDLPSVRLQGPFVARSAQVKHAPDRVQTYEPLRAHRTAVGRSGCERAWRQLLRWSVGGERRGLDVLDLDAEIGGRALQPEIQVVRRFALPNSLPRGFPPRLGPRILRMEEVPGFPPKVLGTRRVRRDVHENASRRLNELLVRLVQGSAEPQKAARIRLDGGRRRGPLWFSVEAPTDWVAASHDCQFSWRLHRQTIVVR